MSGGKNQGRNRFNSEHSFINFVPCPTMLGSFRPNLIVDQNPKPGIFTKMLQCVPKNKTYVLSFDGKELAPGLT